MKVKVIKKFRDKTTGNIRHIGDTFTCNKERFAELTKETKYVEQYNEDAPEKTEDAPEKTTAE